MPDKQFTWRNVSAKIVETTPEILRDTARYEIRLILLLAIYHDSPALSTAGDVTKLSLILAHVRDPVNFPFEIPGSLCLPSDLWAAWQAFSDELPSLWNELYGALSPNTTAEAIHWTQEYLRNLTPAQAETLVLMTYYTEHGYLPSDLSQRTANAEWYIRPN